MRRKREELREAVIGTARNYVNGVGPWRPLVNAVEALDAHDAAEMTGEGARWVHGSPETSQEAAALAAPVQGSTRHQIVKMLASGGPRTDDSLEEWLEGQHQTVSSARNWLVRAGWVQDSGLRASTRSGRQAVCWELTPAGHRQIEDL